MTAQLSDNPTSAPAEKTTIRPAPTPFRRDPGEPALTRAATIRTLLERHHEFASPRRSGNGGNQTGLLLMPHEPRCNMLARDAVPPNPPIYRRAICTCRYRHFVELARLLNTMREDRASSLIGNANHSLRSLHWHIRERYLACDYTLKTIQFVHGKAVGVVGKQLDKTGYRQIVTPLASNQALVEGKPPNWEAEVAQNRRKRAHAAVEARIVVATWSREVQPAKVELGIGWIADSWTLSIEPELPAEKLVAA